MDCATQTWSYANFPVQIMYLLEMCSKIRRSLKGDGITFFSNGLTSCKRCLNSMNVEALLVLDATAQGITVRKSTIPIRHAGLGFFISNIWQRKGVWILLWLSCLCRLDQKTAQDKNVQRASNASDCQNVS